MRNDKKRKLEIRKTRKWQMRNYKWERQENEKLQMRNERGRERGQEREEDKERDASLHPFTQNNWFNLGKL